MASDTEPPSTRLACASQISIAFSPARPATPHSLLRTHPSRANVTVRLFALSRLYPKTQ
ncbi:hypothetical protein KU392_04645 [Advenella alkanexedens]|uniref:Uncharacterized protein n=1 Tax=Advenella alkanexedens TaxID=1481665 RepID=A0ABS6NLN6_9BURK|nr:hypothetical protein [Advenella alkanexedens]MBV4396547.1 hypothetical protein [Advenella alkanexedens]